MGTHQQKEHTGGTAEDVGAGANAMVTILLGRP